MRYPGGNGEIQPQPPHMIGPTWAKNVDGTWHLPELSLGWGVLDWWSQYVNTPAGENDYDTMKFLFDCGRPLNSFVPTKEQIRFTLWWYAIDSEGNWSFREGIFRRMKGHGKDPFAAALALAELCGPVRFSHFDDNGEPVGKRQHAAWVTIAAVSQDQPLALDTKVPTPSGWSTVGELSVGDFVLGSDGNPAEVKRETSVMHGLDCYKVTFSDGTEVVASASHGWTTERLNGHGDSYETVTVTTEELARTVRGSKNRKRHRIPVVGMELPETNLEVDPWFLGYWLGDGFSKDSGFVCAVHQRDELEVLMKEVMADFQTLVWFDQVTENGSWSVGRIKNNDRTRDSESFRAKLRNIGVLGNKHIPDEYMFAGTEQRRELLRGLIDSDGGVTSGGEAYFVNNNHELVRQFVELAKGLGFNPHVRSTGEALRVQFPAGDAFAVAKIAAKRNRQRPFSARSTSRYRYVESVQKVNSVPVKCIGIDTDDHLFQVTESRVLTHNTKNTFALFPVMMSKKLKADYGIQPNRFIIYEEFGGRIESATSSPASMEGNRPTFVIENEIQWWGSGPDGKINDGHAMHDVIEGNITKIPSARRLAICNAHIPGNDSVLEKLHDKWMQIEAGDAVDVGMLYDALEAPADTPISEIPSEKVDPEGYAAGLIALMEGLKIARGDSVWLPLEEIMLSILDISNRVTESRRKFLNQVNAAEDSWVSPNEWARVALTDKLFELKRGERITLGFDGSKSNDWTALVACRVSDGCLFVIKVWDPAKYNGEIPREDVDTVVRNTIDKYDVVGFRADIREFEAYVDLWGQLCRKKVKVNASPNNPVAFDMRSNQKKFALDCERFYDAVVEREVFHDNNAVLRQHVLNAKIHPTIYDANSIRKASKDSKKKIDAAVCAVLAFGCRQEYLMSKNYRTGRVTVIR